MSCALNSAEAKVQLAISTLLNEQDATVSIPLALRHLRSAVADLNKLRAESPQRRVLDQHVEIGRPAEPPQTLDIGCDMAPAVAWRGGR
jgi:hypothetical protein